MANYTEQDVMNAVEQGLITDKDAEYLLAALEPSPIPAALGAVAGAALGGGLAGAKLLGKGAQKTAPDLMTNPKIPPRMGTLGGYLGTAAAGLGGGIAGGLTGAALTPEGSGVEGKTTVNSATGSTQMDRDMALRMLIDPNISGKQKREILAQLKAAEEAAPVEHNDSGMADKLMTLGGILAGGLTGGYGGYKLGTKLTPKVGVPLFPPNPASGNFMNALRAIGSTAASPGPAAGLLGTTGAVAGGLSGNALGNALFNQPSPYEEPL